MGVYLSGIHSISIFYYVLLIATQFTACSTNIGRDMCHVSENEQQRFVPIMDARERLIIAHERTNKRGKKQQKHSPQTEDGLTRLGENRQYL